MSNLSFESAARWTERRKGVAECDQTAQPLEFSAPQEFQGEAGYWTPEHLLLGAVASCFVTTFRAIAELSRFEAAALEVSALGAVLKSAEGFEFGEITLRPVLTIREPGQRERALRLLEKTEQLCLISRALKAPVHLKARVDVAAGTRPALVG